MSKLNLDDVLFMCLGTADMVEPLLEGLEKDTFLDRTVREDGLDPDRVDDP
jgi:hypothetical protein